MLLKITLLMWYTLVKYLETELTNGNYFLSIARLYFWNWSL